MEGKERVLSRVYDLLDKCSHSAHRVGGNRTHTTIAEPQTASIAEKAQVNYACKEARIQVQKKGCSIELSQAGTVGTRL